MKMNADIPSPSVRAPTPLRSPRRRTRPSQFYPFMIGIALLFAAAVRYRWIAAQYAEHRISSSIGSSSRVGRLHMWPQLSLRDYWCFILTALGEAESVVEPGAMVAAAPREDCTATGVERAETVPPPQGTI
jgi:hypothetical protein